MKSFNLPASNRPASNEELARWQERVTRRYPMRITRDISVEHEIRRRELKDMSVEPQLKIRETEAIGRIPSVISILSGPRRTLTPQLSRFPRLRNFRGVKEKI